MIPHARALAVVAVAAAVLSCGSLGRDKRSAADVTCPQKQKPRLVYDEQHEVVRSELDGNADGRADQTFFLERGRIQRAEIDLDFDGATDLWLEYDGEDHVVRWREVTPGTSRSAAGYVSSGRFPDDPPPPELARLIPGLDPPALPECLQRSEVQEYLVGVRKGIYEHWAVSVAPSASAGRARARLSFSLDRSGRVVGACVREADDPATGVVTALFDAGPFPAMPERAECLSRHHLIATFATEPDP